MKLEFNSVSNLLMNNSTFKFFFKSSLRSLLPIVLFIILPGCFGGETKRENTNATRAQWFQDEADSAYAKVISMELADSNACKSAEGLARKLSVLLSGCHVADGRKDLSLQFFEQCFTRIPMEIRDVEVKSKPCAEKFVKEAGAMLTHLAAVQFDSKFDKSFANSDQSQNSIAKSGLKKHFHWLNLWKNINYTFSKEVTAVDFIFEKLREKLARLYVRDVKTNDKQQAFDLQQKLRFFAETLEIASGIEQGLHSAFRMRLYNYMLRSMDERISLLARIHDINCQFVGCSGKKNSGDLAFLIASIESLGRVGSGKKSDSNNANGDYGDIPEYLAKWQNQLESGRDRLFKDIKTMSRDGSLAGIELSSLGPEWSEFQVYLRKYYEMSQMWKQHGTFRAPSQNLQVALTDGAIEHAKQSLGDIGTKLLEDRRTLSQTREKVVSEMLANNLNCEKLQNLESELDRRKKELAYITQDITGVQLKVEEANVELANYADDLSAKFRKSKFKNFFQSDSDTIKEHYTISPSDVPDESSKTYYAQGISIPIKAGELVRIQISGEWSPTCAIERVYGSGAGGFIGPEGYRIGSFMGKSFSKSKTSSEVSANYSGEENSESACESWGSVFGGFFRGIATIGGIVAAPFNPVLGAAVGSTAGGVVEGLIGGSENSKCSRTFSGKRTDAIQGKSDVSSDDSRIGIEFSSGLKIPYYTPWPEFPAGSLVVIDNVTMRAAQKTMAWVAEKDGILHFAVNDCKAPNSKSSASKYFWQGDSAGQLTMNVYRTLPKEAAVRGLLLATRASLETIRKHWPSYIKMGSLTPDERMVLREKIKLEIERTSGESNNGYSISYQDDPELQAHFDFWINHELLQLDRKLRIQELGRQGQLLTAQIAYLENSILDAKVDGRLVERPLYWSIFDYDMNQSNAETHIGSALDLLEYQVLPVMNILHPDSLTKISPRAIRFPNLREMVELDHLSNYLAELTSTVRDSMNQSRVDRNHMSTTIVIRFPTPEALRKILSKTAPTKEDLDLPVGDLDTAKNIWAALEGTQKNDITLRISPDAIYQGEHQVSSGRLPCNVYAPIVQSMGLIFKLKSGDLAGQYQTGDFIRGFQAPAIQEFTSPQGMANYHLLNTTYSSINLFAFKVTTYNQARFDVITEILNTQDYKNVGNGLSPFGGFRLNGEVLRREAMDILKNDLDSLEEIAIVANVRALSNGSENILYPFKCQYEY